MINSAVFCHAADDEGEKERQLTSAVCHGVTVSARAASASGLQPGSRLAKRICKTFTLTERLCHSCDPQKKKMASEKQ